MSRRPPRTSYGYLAPSEARVRGWTCNNDDCGTGDEPAPRSWPFPCRLCGQPTDATFHEPWAHEARAYQIRHQLSSRNRYRREMAELEQHVWAYKDACLRGDRAAAGDAWEAYRRARRAQGDDGWSTMPWGMYELIRLASQADDIGRAAVELLEWYPFVDTRGVDDDNTRRTMARGFVSLCIEVLQRESAIDHPREAELYAAMRDVAVRAESVLMDHHQRGFQRIGELRALHRSRAAMARARRSPAVAFDGLPPVSWRSVRAQETTRRGAEDPGDIIDLLGPDPDKALAIIDAIVEKAETHDDLGPLAELVRRLDGCGAHRALTHLVRARLHVVTGDLQAAVRELDLGSRATDLLARRLRPQILATQGLLRARVDPENLDKCIELCRAGRRAGLRWWRRATAADAGLTRLLLWRALRRGTPPGRQSEDVRAAVRLIRRTCRPWHIHGADDRLLLQEALAARDALRGPRSDERRHRAWRHAVEAPWSTAAKARLAVAWAEWAVGTGVAEFAAEAYGRLVALVSQDAVARHGASAKQRVLAAAQEYAEEAGYWLARTGRYREAVLALETGRAVGLTEVLERRVAAATGGDPLSLDVSYEEITAETGDGAVVYLAAAKAGGYALVVAATHDPQYVDLPKLDRSTVAGIVDKVLPEAEPSTGFARLAAAGAAPGGTRDLRPVTPAPADPMAEGLRTLWNDGVKDLVLASARGQVVTVIPVGLLNLLPLHAAGEPGSPGDRFAEWRHAGNFSAIRYAPNARALRRCRDTVRELADREHTLLAIDVPDGYGVDPGGQLRYVTRETVEVTRRWTGLVAQPVHACTWEEFRTAADHHTVWHLACHGSAEPRSILDTRLYFADRQVTLEELRLTLKPGGHRLAVLSACRTNLTGSAMPNEVVGLPSALIQIGFAGVMASAWAVDDLATTYLMTAFYQRWCADGEAPAVALNRAQQWLRRATRADLVALLPDVDPAGGPGEYPYVDPRYWAAFAYTGA